MPRVKVVHGRWGEVLLNGQVLAEVTGIDYTVEIERVDVPQVNVRWGTFTEGGITGTGTLNMHKVFSRWEDLFFSYVAQTPDQLRAAQAAGTDPRPPMQLTVNLWDPHSFGQETETLDGLLFWQYTGGFSLTELVERQWPFSFDNIIPGIRIPVQ